MTEPKSKAAGANAPAVSASGSWQSLVRGQIQRRYDYLAREDDFPPDGRARAERDGYQPDFLDALPHRLTAAYSGAGNPLQGIDLASVETLIDLGCGAGLDVFQASLAPDPPEMLLAVDFSEHMLRRLKSTRTALATVPRPQLFVISGDLEHLPVATCCADLVIGNASFNLCLEPGLAFAEAFRILRPGGHLSLAEFVRTGPLPIEAADNPMAWNASIGGIETPDALVSLIRKAGFCDVELYNRRPSSRIDVIETARLTARRPTD